MDGNSGSSRTVAAEEGCIHLVVSAEVVHVHEKRRHIDDIAERGAGRSQDVGDILDDRRCLLPDIERRGAHLVDACSSDGVVCPSTRRSRHKGEAAGNPNMRVRATWLSFALHHPGIGFVCHETHFRGRRLACSVL